MMTEPFTEEELKLRRQNMERIGSNHRSDGTLPVKVEELQRTYVTIDALERQIEDDRDRIMRGVLELLDQQAVSLRRKNELIKRAEEACNRNADVIDALVKERDSEDLNLGFHNEMRNGERWTIVTAGVTPHHRVVAELAPSTVKLLCGHEMPLGAGKVWTICPLCGTGSPKEFLPSEDSITWLVCNSCEIARQGSC